MITCISSLSKTGLNVKPPPRTLRSGTQSLAAVPRINLERYGRRAFSCAGPSLWNALPLGLRTQQDLEHFRRDLKVLLAERKVKTPCNANGVFINKC